MVKLVRDHFPLSHSTVSTGWLKHLSGEGWGRSRMLQIFYTSEGMITFAFIQQHYTALNLEKGDVLLLIWLINTVFGEVIAEEVKNAVVCCLCSIVLQACMKYCTLILCYWTQPNINCTRSRPQFLYSGQADFRPEGPIHRGWKTSMDRCWKHRFMLFL